VVGEEQEDHQEVVVGEEIYQVLVGVVELWILQALEGVVGL